VLVINYHIVPCIW